MGRLTFLHFLQRKGWLCGDLNYLQNLFVRSQYQDDYLDSVLEPLFFGILNTKQLIKLHLNGDAINVLDLITEPLYVFPTQSASDVLKLLRKNKIHMAVIKDEFGGTEGILTMEDLIENNS